MTTVGVTATMVTVAVVATTVAATTGGSESLTAGAPRRPVTTRGAPAQRGAENSDVVAGGELLGWLPDQQRSRLTG
jgi:hypothetical protein